MLNNNFNTSEYISHHLKHYSNSIQEKFIDFSIINIDTIILSFFCGIITLFLLFIVFYINNSNFKKIRLIFEILIEKISIQYKNIFKKKNNFIIPLSLLIFIWLTIMNFLDLLPVDLIGIFFYNKSINFKIVPTTDLNCTLGISLGILLIILYFNIKNKGFLKFNYELISKPFGIIFLPFNLILNIIELISKIFSLAMRLFGNIYTGELIFLLISLLSTTSNKFLYFLHISTGLIWSIFHIFVIFLQSFIFMMLTIIYISQTNQIH